jgi:hypothetical protein
MKIQSTFPTDKQRRQRVGQMSRSVREIGKARTLGQLGIWLTSLHALLIMTAQDYGINPSTDIKDRLGKRGSTLIPGRTPFNFVKSAVLQFAKENSGRDFTVDDVLAIPALRGIPRRSITANLNAMSRRGTRPLLRTRKGEIGCKGKPAAYRLRR